MKKYILVGSLFLAFSSCTNHQVEVAMTQQRDSLIAVIDAREALVNEFIVAFNEVERNLDSVSRKQHIILLKANKGPESKAVQKEKIDAEIKAINALMEQNNKKLKSLYAKLKTSESYNVELEKTVVLLSHQLNTKYAELDELNRQLKMANAQVDFMVMIVDILSVENIEQALVISEQANDLNKAYYIIAEARELQKWNLIDKQGGFLGIGQSSKLSNDMDKNLFTMINTIETTSIPINSKDIVIITTHPSESFTFSKTEKVVNSIMISDPKKFWSVSKYLVISH